MSNLDVAVRLKFLTSGEEKLKLAAKDLQAFGKSLGQLSGRTTGRFAGDMGKAWGATAKLSGALDKTASSAGRTAGALQKIGRSANDIDRTRGAVDRLAKSTNTLGAAERRVRGVGGIGGGMGAGSAVVAGGVLGAHAKARRAAVKEGFIEAASRITPEAYVLGAGGAIAAGATIGATATAGIAAAGVATKEAIDRNKAFAEIQKKVNLEAGQSWETLDRKVRGVSTKIGMAYADAASIFAQGGQGNIATKDLEEFAMLSAKTAVGWDMGAKEAAQMFTEVKAQTRKTIPEMKDLADLVNGLGDVSAAAEKDIGAMAQRALAGMQAAGVGEKEALAMMTALRGVGMPDEVASRFLTATTSKLRTASTAGKDALKAFKEIGTSGAAIEKGMQTKPMETMLDLLDRIKKSKNPVGIMKRVLGGEWFDEGLRLADAAPEIIRLLQYIGSGQWRGSLDRAMEIDLGTTQAKLAKLKESILDIMATAAKPIVLPWLDGIADKWAQAAQRFRDAQQRSEDARARAVPVGESVASYEQRFKLDRPINRPGPPMISQIEGATPHIDAKQINQAAAEGVASANNLFDALQKLNTTVTPVINADAAVAGANAVAAAAERAAGAMRALQNFGVPGKRVNPTLTGAPRGAAPSGGSSGGAAPSAPTPGKQARAGGGVHIAQAHFHGVKDVASLERALARHVRMARSNALHDVG